MSLQSNVVAGAIAGLAGGAALAAWWHYGQRLGITQEPLPRRVEQWAEDQAGVRDQARPETKEAVAQSGHLLAATALGAVFGGLRSSGYLPSFASGPLFGLAVYGMNVAGIGNALGITRGPESESSSVVGTQLFEHALYGAVTGWVTDWLGRRM